MNQTLIGYFENENGATRARQELLQAGFTESHMRIQAGSSAGSMPSASGTTAMSGQGTTSGESHSGIGGFFRSLFGMDDNDEQVSTYSEGLRRGGYLLSVSADPARGVTDALFALVVGAGLGLATFIMQLRGYVPGTYVASADELAYRPWRPIHFLTCAVGAAPIYVGIRLFLGAALVVAGGVLIGVSR